MKSLIRASALTLLFATTCMGGELSQQIDALLAKDWQQNKLTANPPASDETFVRRVHLDIIGRIPTLQEARVFQDGTGKDKRAKLIDQLLASEGHAQHMFHFWADILRVQSRPNGGQGDMTGKPYLEHVKRRIRENQPYDAFVRELLTAQGKVWENPAIGYYMRDIGMPLDNLAASTRIFLGTRIECAQCHNHPFDKWTQMQFYQMAAFTYPLETNFTGISLEGMGPMKRAAEKDPATAASARWMGRVFDNLGDFVRYSKVAALPTRLLKLPHDYQYTDAKPKDVVSPVTMLGKTVKCEPTGETVKAFADWMTSKENPRFTTVIANRLWKKVFGVGLIEPVDEILDNTVAMNPALMKQLEQLMVSARYDMRAYLRVLYNTQAYQNEATHAELMPGEVYHFTGPVLRRLTAEQIYDSFVTLIHATPDLPRRHGVDLEMAGKMVYRGKLSDALELLELREIFEGALKSSTGYELISERSKVLRDEYNVAQKAKDKRRIEELNLEIRSLEFTARTGIHDHIVVPAVARLYTKKTGKPAPEPIPVKKPTLEELKKIGLQRAYIDVPGYDIDQTIPREEKVAEAAREEVYLRELKEHGIPQGQVENYLKARRAQFREWLRAADLESPAPRGHYLREFGQSDRDMIENANSDASMPQALVLMNSELFESILKPHTQLRLNLAAAKYPDDQMVAVYETLLSREPTVTEKTAWSKAREAGLGIEDLVYALINTQQFIFLR